MTNNVGRISLSHDAPAIKINGSLRDVVKELHNLNETMKDINDILDEICNILNKRFEKQ